MLAITCKHLTCWIREKAVFSEQACVPSLGKYQQNLKKKKNKKKQCLPRVDPPQQPRGDTDKPPNMTFSSTMLKKIVKKERIAL